MNDFKDLAIRILTLNSLLFFIVLMFCATILQKAICTRLDVNKRHYLVMAASMNLVFSLTLRWWNWEGYPPVFWLINGNLWKVALDINANWAFNFLLFAFPGYILLRNLKKSALMLFIFLVLLSFCIETLQGLFGWGSSDPSDWTANSIGALVGIFLSSRSALKRIRSAVPSANYPKNAN